MSGYGPARTSEIASGSNTTVKSSIGTLHSVIAFPTGQGASVRIENTDLGAAPDLNATGTGTIARLTALASNTANAFDFAPGVSFGKLVVAATSNTRVVVVYE